MSVILEGKYMQLFEQATEAIVIIDAESGIILECNQAAVELFGKTKDELIGQHEAILYSSPETGNHLTKTFKDHSRLQNGGETPTEN